MKKNLTLAILLIGALTLVLGCTRYLAEEPLKRETEVAMAPKEEAPELKPLALTEEAPELKPLAAIEEAPAEIEPSETKEVVKMGGITGEYADSASASAGVIELTKKWKMYPIDLVNKDLSYISGGFCWVTSYYDNPNGCVIYLDDIKYE
ncbi:hypothetical protein ES705_25791 [subsurface metagenome]|nr:hypothetical protein [Clostridia bacterium]